jgi:hypothetical protein
MAETAIIRSAVEKMGVAFDLPEVGEAIAPDDMLATVRAALVDRIIYLLNSNPERLMAILPPDIPEQIADLVIERQIAKAETRARHKDRS